MTDAFEKNIREKLRNHSMPVDERLWTDISHAMKGKARQRRIRLAAAWTAALSAAAMLCVALLLPEKNIGPASGTAALMKNVIDNKTYAEKTTAIASLHNSPKAPETEQRGISRARRTEPYATGESIELRAQSTENREQSTENRELNAEREEQKETNRVQTEKATAHTAAHYHSGEDYEERKSSSKPVLSASLYAYGPAAARSGKDFRLTMNNTTFSCLNTQNMNMDAVSGMHKQMHADHKQPIKIGASARYDLGSGVGIESGLRYTLLHSTFTSLTNSESYDQHVHMLGIPLNMTYDIASIGHLSFYTSLGGEVAHCISVKSEVKNSVSHPWQISLSAAVGVQYDLGANIGIYVEPGLAHHFDNGSSLETAYTEHPTDFSLLVGVRMNLRK